jgi:magnesium transporter
MCAVPNIALRRPLPRPRGRRPTGTVDPVVPEAVAEPEIIEAAGLRWIHIESPRTADRDWLEEHFKFHHLDYEDVYSRNQRPKLDQYDEYVFIVLHFPLYEKETGRVVTAELDLFMGPDYLITLPNIPLPPLAAMFERYREREDLREDVFSKGSGYLLYKIVDTGVDASFPMLRKMSLKLERLEDDIFEGRSSEIVRDLSDAKQEIINFRKIVRPQRAVLRDLERTKQRYLQEELEIYFDDISDAAERIWDTLENYKEVVEALESTNEAVLSHRLNDSFRILTAASVVLLPLTLIASIFGMNVAFPGEGSEAAFYLILAVLAVVLGGLVLLFRRRGWL